MKLQSRTSIHFPRLKICLINSMEPRCLRESWIRGCSASRTIPSAGLHDYEDTRLKTSSRVRKVLSLAWKVSTHEHVTCTLDAGGDAPQLTSKETRPTARYARQSTGAFADPKTPHPREGPRQGVRRLWDALGRFARP